jgi:transposase-like protein
MWRRQRHPVQDGADRGDGQVEIDVPRDRAGTFEPQIVRKRQRRLSGVDEIVLLYAKGLTTEEISAHFAEILPTDDQRPHHCQEDGPGRTRRERL